MNQDLKCFFIFGFYVLAHVKQISSLTPIYHRIGAIMQQKPNIYLLIMDSSSNNKRYKDKKRNISCIYALRSSMGT